MFDNSSGYNLDEIEYPVGLYAESSPDKRNRWIQNSIISMSLSISEPLGIYAVVRMENAEVNTSEKTYDPSQVHLSEEERAEYLLWRNAFNKALWDYEGLSE